MRRHVAILEDDRRRIDEMRRLLAQMLPTADPIFFLNAREMINWLGEHLSEVALISLDHDLPLYEEDGRSIDCGTGRQVVDFLATTSATCPVVVHSSNLDCAAGMVFALRDTGWTCSRVHPRDDLAWIADEWMRCVAQHLRGARNTP